MITLNISLSSFRLSVQSSSRLPACSQIHLSTTTRRLSAFESPHLPRPAPSALQPTPTEIILPPSWNVRWTEHLPDRLAVQAAALIIRVVRPRSPSKRVSSFLGCTLRPTERSLGTLKLSLYSLATGTVCNSFCLRSVDGPLTSVTVSFNAVVEQPVQLQLNLSNITFPISLTPDQSTTNANSYQQDHSVSHNSHQGSVELPPAFLSVEHQLSKSFVSSVPSPLLPPPDGPTSQKQPRLFCRSLEPLTISAPSLFSLAHSSLKISLYKFPVKNGQEGPLKTIDVSLHAIWGALQHPLVSFTYASPVTSSEPCSVYLDVKSNHGPPLGQLIGGITTDTIVTGAKPVIFGIPFSNLSRIPHEPDIPEGWVHLIDSFGYHFYRHISANADVWLPPISSSASEALAADVIAANAQGLSRVRDGLYHHSGSGFHVWLHPSSKCIPGSGADSEETPINDPLEDVSSLGTVADSRGTSRDDQLGSRNHERGVSSRTTSFTLSTIDALDYHPASFFRAVEQGSTFEPAFQEPGSAVLPSMVGESRIVELQWMPLSGRAIARGGAEGHTLTTVCNRQGVLRFGGSEGQSRVRSNTLQWFNTSSMNWRTVRARGVLPVPRTGHGAVALGSDASRLMIFGGTSSLGRLNDLHVFHTGNDTWSPVQYTGTPPEVRARMGMAATPDGRIAFVFGGRSLYRWLGGRYYDPVFVHSFHAERSQWVQMEPRGSGPRPAPRSGCVMEFLSERLMVVHGGYEDGTQFFDDTFLFDLASCSWVLPPYPDEDTKPEAREGHTSTMISGNSMVISGGDGPSSMLGDTHLFDGDKLRWTERPSMVGLGPGQVVGGAMATIADGRAIFAGGENGFELSRSTYQLNVSHRSSVGEEELSRVVRERGADAQACVVCMDREVDTMLLWCGHSVCCSDCVKQVNRVCPICRKGFSKVVYNAFVDDES